MGLQQKCPFIYKFTIIKWKWQYLAYYHVQFYLNLWNNGILISYQIFYYQRQSNCLNRYSHIDIYFDTKLSILRIDPNSGNCCFNIHVLSKQYNNTESFVKHVLTWLECMLMMFWCSCSFPSCEWGWVLYEEGLGTALTWATLGFWGGMIVSRICKMKAYQYSVSIL